MRSYLRNAICLGSLLAAMLLCAGCGKSNSPTSQVPPLYGCGNHPAPNGASKRICGTL